MTRWLVPLAVAAAAATAGTVAPLASLLLVCLLLGAVVANAPLRGRSGFPDIEAAAKVLLRWGIVLLGLRLSVGDVAAVGWTGIAMVLVTVIVTFRLTQVVGRRMGLDTDLVDLVAAGFSICGAAAIAAVQDSLGARRSNAALGVALVTIAGTTMMFAIPVLATVLGLDPRETSLWMGASIHEVAQVVAGTALVGGGSIAVAMSVKLGRVMMLVPVHHAVIRSNRTPDCPRATVPWFLWGFVAAIAVRSAQVLPDAVLDVGSWTANVLLGAGMFGLGLGLAVRDLWPVPPRALLLAAFATAVATGVPLAILAVA
ncbi:putative sulfate exporter family transporter [Nocardioides sp. AE5]|uniref:YeiH family protein n=1 Tax=Nocardioides sp. AE5 TaxID=2962573 RepID=UPI0028816850|nr:putative sulfate exporter family transporter [Nocardioides sp. AE5]MDT0203379.1 putative sulfate exporter family transporter [Nocardioides sp. AE5]